MAESDSIRTCTACCKPFPATTEFFVRQKNGKFGLTSTCKSCRKEKTLAWRAENQDKVRASDRAHYAKNSKKELANNKRWRDANQEKVRSGQAAWHAVNKEHVFKRRQEYYLANKDKIRANYAEWYAKNRDSEIANAAARRAKNPEKDRENARAWYHANHEQGRAAREAWFAANPHKKRTYSETRRARKMGAPGQVSSNIIDILMEKQQGKCACCGEALTTFHLDHIMPLALGGAHADENMQLLTPRCNMMKGGRHPDVYAKYREKLNT